jgi:N-6 DNA Methylase
MSTSLRQIEKWRRSINPEWTLPHGVSFTPVRKFASRLAQYIAEARAANSEPGRALAFLHMLRSTFEEVQAGSPGSLVPELEKRVTIHEGSLLAVGRIDALLGNLIIEFKLDLEPTPLRDAIDQLKRYVSALWSIEGDRRNYMLIATDGLRFRVYSPSQPTATGIVDPSQISLDEVNRLDISTSSPEEAYRWLDRYLLSRDRTLPTPANIVGDFGRDSPVYRAGMAILEAGWGDARLTVSAPFDEWQRYLSVVYGSESGDELLFLRHTYLATLAKLMVYTYYSSGAIPSREKLREILDGDAFKDWGIENFLEEDFFSWLSREDAEITGRRLAEVLIEVLERYDLSKLDNDVLKGLYEGLVDPESRHDLGEYYTPDWIADLVVKTLEVTPQDRVLDPACGSGTFLVAAVKRKRAALARQKAGALDRIVSSVFGVDVHPLAVLVSKANYLLALGELVKTKTGPLLIPVYLANSIDFPSAKTEIQHGARTYRYPVSKSSSLGIPEEVVARHAEGPIIDSITDFARESAKKPQPLSRVDFDNRLSQTVPVFLGLTAAARDTLWDTARELTSLIGSKRDSIFAFIVKNVYRPASIKEVDVLVGNPPWLSYRYIRVTDYQKAIKKFILKDHHLLNPQDSRLLTHMELATLFFVRATGSYVREGGRLGLVMPRSVFTADQHANFRREDFQPKIGITGILDFDRNQQSRLSPIFSVESCVIYATKGSTTIYPIHCEQFTGDLGVKNATLVDFESRIESGIITKTSRQISIVQIGDRSAWSYEDTRAIDNLREGQSPYSNAFHQGATLVPRAFWFVRPVVHPRLGSDPGAPYVESTPHALEAGKQNWTGLSGQVEARFLFATLLGEDILPFSHLSFRLVVLPVIVGGGTPAVLDSAGLASAGFPLMRAWTQKAESSWAKVRAAKAGRMSLQRRIDNQRGIRGQSTRNRLLVVYNTSGRKNLSACLVRLANAPTIKLNAHTFRTSGFVAESSTYYASVKSEDEGHYLVSILNSNYVFELVRTIKATRHVHKKVWELPIGEYNPKNRTASRLVEIGRRASQKAESMLANPEIAIISSTGKLRRQIRLAIQDEISEINALVEKLVSRKSTS